MNQNHQNAQIVEIEIEESKRENKKKLGKKISIIDDSIHEIWTEHNTNIKREIIQYRQHLSKFTLKLIA
jgi:hypothetical protein